MNNLDIWEKVRKVPDTAIKAISGGRLKGMSDINPMWRLKALTEQFGVCGIGWKYIITEKRIEEGRGGEKAAFVDINLYIKANGEWSEAIPGTGGSAFIAAEKNGLYTSDECFKMALTDAISVACKALGIGADVYWDKDKTKYSGHPDPEPEPKPTQTQLIAIGTLAQRKGVDLSLKGVGWTHKANSALWTMTDYCKVEKELEKLEDKK